ncbi:MAG: hypothetical protein AMK72_13005 [Planctomycetes bacterium SM23_25]|nr:MAG: hypothetical protein AMK72_13005 [Planctomycetes bacterium SM23_25]
MFYVRLCIGLLCVAGLAAAAAPAPRTNLIAHGGDWTVRDKAVWVNGGPGPKLIARGTDFADGQAGVEVYFDGAAEGNAGLIVRASEAGVGADRFIGYEIALDPRAGHLRIGRHRHDFSLIRDIKTPVPLKTWIPLVVRINGDRIEVDVDGKRVASVSDTRGALPKGAVGLRPWQRPAGFRNLWFAANAGKRSIELRQDLIAGAGPSSGKPSALKFEPRRTALLDLVCRGEGLSPEGRRYLDRLSAFAERRDRLTADAGRLTDEQTVAALAGEVDRFLADEVRRLGPIVFFTRHPLARPNAANCSIWQSVPERWGCSIRIYDPARPDQPARTIFRDAEGSIFDMNLSADARTLFFSFKKKGETCWQLYEIATDGTGLKKISRNPDHYDVGAIELPGGDLLFVSTRRGGYTVCQPGPASNLHVMRRDGTGVRCVSQNTLSDFSPQLLPDGRVLFTRWEYIDRDLTYRQSLWTQNPDGRHYQLFFGNTIRDVGTFWQARPLPGHRDLVVATFAPHHGWPHGAIGLIHTGLGLEAPRDQGFAWITQEFPQIEDRSFRWSYRDPFPVNDCQFLVAYGKGGRFGIYLLDLCDNTAPIVSDPEEGCYGPLLLEPQSTPATVAGVGDGRDPPAGKVRWGTVFVANVYEGLPQIERGRVRYIQIMEQVRKTHDLRGRAYDQSPLMSYATYYAKKCWGRVPVEADGSAHFRAPALQEIYLQVLDGEGRELQRMTSALQLMPDETLGCIGCHEPRHAAPWAGYAAMPAALRREPDRPPLPDWGTDGLVDFVKVVQPVLDAYCVKCHSGADPKGGYDLSGDKTRLFNMAYDNLLGRSRSYRQHHMATGEMLPDEKAKGKPLVHFYWLLRTPTAVNQPLWTGCHASRLPEYLETDHCERKVPPEARQRVYAWIDANVPYYTTYAHSRPHSPGYRDLCTDVENGRLSKWFAQGFLGVYNHRCKSCHGDMPNTNDHGRIWDGQLAWINFTHPEWSAALTAHLAKEAGGRGLGTEKGGKGAPLFPDTHHADYAAMLNAIREGRQKMLAHPRVDMPQGEKKVAPVQ